MDEPLALLNFPAVQEKHILFVVAEQAAMLISCPAGHSVEQLRHASVLAVSWYVRLGQAEQPVSVFRPVFVHGLEI